MYIGLLRFLESMKHNGRSKYKIVRGFNHYKYIFVCYLENILIRHVNIKDCKLVLTNEANVVCSLTSYPGRINECYYAIKSILLQSVKPNRIVLWLASSQFPGNKLPKKYSDLKNVGVEFRFCNDLRSHKKYYYMLQEQKPNELVITFDDDIIYHPDTIKRALYTHKKFPNSIVCNEAKVISLDRTNDVCSYLDWKTAPNGIKRPDIYLYSILTGSGCLYPYGIMPKETFDESNIRSLAFTADDLWITFIAKAFNIQVTPTEIMAKPYTTVCNSQTSHLAQINCLGTGNNDTMKRMFELYPIMKEKLIKALQ